MRNLVGSLRSVLLLMVEDDQTTREALCFALRAEGFEVIAAADGGQALRLASLRLPDLVVTDLSMPVMRGEELCRKLREDPSTAQIPVIVCSGESRLTAFGDTMPAERFLEKPVSLPLLIQMAHELTA